MNQIAAALAIVLAVVLGGSGLALWYFNSKLDDANDATIAAEAEHAAEAESRSEFEASTKACSDATVALEQRAADVEKKYADGKVEAEKKSRATTAYVNELLTRTRPAGLDECASVRKELDDEVDRRHPAR